MAIAAAAGQTCIQWCPSIVFPTWGPVPLTLPTALLPPLPRPFAVHGGGSGGKGHADTAALRVHAQGGAGRQAGGALRTLCMLRVLRSHGAAAAAAKIARCSRPACVSAALHAAEPPESTCYALVAPNSSLHSMTAPPCCQAQVVPVSAGGTTASYRQWCVDAIAGDIKEFICR